MLRSSFRGPVLLALLMFTTSASASAQTPTANTLSDPQSQATPSPSPSPTPSLERQFLKNILRDQRAIWTSPFHLNGDDAEWLAPLGLGTAALIATDRRTAGALHDNRLRLNISRDISYLGSGFGAGTIAGSLYLIGRARGDARLRETGLLAAEALIDDSAVFPVIKVVTERTRPRKDQARGRFFHGGFSFPSGHAMSVWSLAAVVGDEYKERPLVRFGVYGLAIVVSASRFTGRNHFLSDVFVGGAIGYGIGRYVYRTHHVQGSNQGGGGEAESATRSRLFPIITPHYNRGARIYGIALSWRL
jgi:membrane-associated phospholipid phosphatase